MMRKRKLGAAVCTVAAVTVVAGCSELSAERITSVELDEPTTVTPTPPLMRGAALYVDPNSAARRQVEAWRGSRGSDAALLENALASQPTGVWFGDWNSNIRSAVSDVAGAAAGAGALPVMVAYNIPQRDCGSHSSGGASSADAYRSWIRDFARGLAGRPAIVIVEPDALASTACLSAAARTERFSLLRYAVELLKAENAFVYLDAGHANWLSPAEAAQRLVEAGIAAADGFALNVSNFVGNAQNIAYGEEVARRSGGKGFVIDTSRNGAGSNGEWCNPAGRALGTRPTTYATNAAVHAFLWVKKPGESDGKCNGGPSAGQWWAEYALTLAKNTTPTMAMADATR